MVVVCSGTSLQRDSKKQATLNNSHHGFCREAYYREHYRDLVQRMTVVSDHIVIHVCKQKNKNYYIMLFLFNNSIKNLLQCWETIFLCNCRGSHILPEPGEPNNFNTFKEAKFPGRN